VVTSISFILIITSISLTYLTVPVERLFSRLFVCLSQAGIMTKWLKLRSWIIMQSSLED